MAETVFENLQKQCKKSAASKNKQPVPLQAEPAPSIPYPINALPQKMRQAAEAISEAIQLPIAAAGQCVIGAATYLAQTRVNTWNPYGDPTGSPCSIFFLTILDSGAGKSAARKLAYKVIDEIEKEEQTRHTQERFKITSQAKNLKGSERKDFYMKNPLPFLRKFRYTDTTFEPLVADFIRGMSAARWDTDEGSQALCGHSFKAETVSAILGGLTKAFDDGSFSRNRSAANPDDSGTVYHRRLMINLLAQMSAISSVLSNQIIIKSGFLARFFFSRPDSLVGTRIITIESIEKSAHSDKRLQEFWEHCKELSTTQEFINTETGEVIPPVLEPDTAAKQVWIAFRNELEIEQGPLGKFSEMTSFASRNAELALRLATVMAFFDKMPSINADYMDRACKLARYSLDEWHHFIETDSKAEIINDAAYVMNWMLDTEDERNKQWLNFNKTMAGKAWPKKFRPAKTRDQVLKVLVQHNQLLTEDGKNFSINPLAESAESAEPQQQCGSASAEGLRSFADTRSNPLESDTAAGCSQYKVQIPSTKPHSETLTPEPKKARAFVRNKGSKADFEMI